MGSSCSCYPCCRKNKPPVLTLEYKPNPESEPDSGRKYDLEPESNPKPEPESRREPDPEPDVASESHPDPGQQYDPQPTSASEAEPDPGRQSDLESVVASESEPDLGRQPDREPTPVDVSPHPESDPMHWFTKPAFSENNDLKLVQGYQNERILSLEEALKPVTKMFPDISQQIQKAQKKRYYSEKGVLTEDKSAAIYIYSMKGTNNLHFHFQKAWDSKDKSQLKPWFKYLKLLKSALNKLPDVQTKVWQQINRSAVEEILQAGQSQLYTCMGTCSRSIEELNDVLDKKPASKVIMVGYGLVSGKDVTPYAEGEAKEVLVWPGAKIYVAKKEIDDQGDLTKMHLDRMGKCYELLSCIFFFVFESVAKRDRCLNFHRLFSSGFFSSVIHLEDFF